MANQRLSDLPQLAALQTGDLIYVVRGGVDYALLADSLVASLTPDYAGIHYSGSGIVTIDLQNLYHLVDGFALDGIDAVSQADSANQRIIMGAARAYGALFSVSAESSGVVREFEFEAFQISGTGVAITGITQANPAVVTAPGHGRSNGDRVKLSTPANPVVGMTEVNDKLFDVAGVAGDTFQLEDDAGAGIDSTGYGAWVSGGEVQEASGIAEIDQDFPNGTIGGGSSSFPTMGVVNDAVELYAKNKDAATNITIENCHLWMFGV
jgi:hypothetical protein